MEQETINYSDIMNLGFTEEFIEDTVYFKQFGFQYSIVQLKLTKKIYIEWTKETQLCEMVRIDNKKRCNIMERMPVKGLDHLSELVDFFCDKKL